MDLCIESVLNRRVCIILVDHSEPSVLQNGFLFLCTRFLGVIDVQVLQVELQAHHVLGRLQGVDVEHLVSLG
jgi:hypothetical protein